MSLTMTDSKNDKPIRKQNRLSSQNENFDFELVEVQVTPDQINPTPSPLDNFTDDVFVDAKAVQENSTAGEDYDSIDRMLSKARFDDFDELQEAQQVGKMLNDAHLQGQKTTQQASTEANIAKPKPAPIIPPPDVVSEIKTNFYVDYFDKRNKLKTANPEPAVAATEINKYSRVENQSSDTMIPEKESVIPHQQPEEDSYLEPSLDSNDSNAPLFNGSGMAVAILSQFKSKQESINKQQEKLIQDFSQKIKASTRVTYTAVFFGVVALAAAITLGVMLLKTKSDVSDLAGTTTALKDNIKNIAKASPDDLEGTDPAIDQLNQKVEGVIEQMKEQSQVSSNNDLKNEVTALQNKVLLLEKTAAISKNTANKPIEPSAPAPVAAVIEKKPTAAPLVKTTPTPVPLVNKATPVVKPVVKVPPVTKPLKKTTTETVPPVTAAVVVTKPTTPPKQPEKTTVTPKKNTNALDKQTQTLPANDINNVIKATTAPVSSVPAEHAPQVAPQAAPKTIPVPQAAAKTTSAPQTGAGWTVNLASSNKMDDAKKTAARFKQQGIPVVISPYKVKNETRYRLQVKGFKSKEEATAYGNKAKATLKLNAVWINP